MTRLFGSLILISGLIFSAQPTLAQPASSLEHWHTGGVGLSTPMGFNMGASYSVVVKGPLFVQASVTSSKDIYVTKHSAFAVGPALGVRHYTDVALTSLSVGPTYLRGTRGADLLAPGTPYEVASLTVTAQMLFREVNMGFELYTNFNSVRNVSGLRLIYRLGHFR
jgi:hypothetical protein